MVKGGRKMKNLLICIIFGIIMLLNSCSTFSQNYNKIYYDYVIEGVINEPGFVNDGYYSYHIMNNIPVDEYWELYPYDSKIGVYNIYMVFQRYYYPDNNWILYHNGKHHMYIPRYKVPPKKPIYRNPPRKPNGNMRPPQKPKPKPGNIRPPQKRHTQPPRNNNNGGSHRKR